MSRFLKKLLTTSERYTCQSFASRETHFTTNWATLRSLDEEILALVEEEEIENEIQEADLVSELIQLSITRIDEFLESKSPLKIVDAPTQHEPLLSPHNFVPSEVVSGNLESSNDPVNESSSSPASAQPSVSVHEATPQVKLPKLDLTKFNGEISNWPTLWDAFESSIHKNTKLAPIDKYNYLNSLLLKPASDAISGLGLTSANYEEAIAILKKRFGNKQQIINRHMEILLNINSVNSSQNIEKLRQLYDTLESHVRSLKSLGVPSSSYGSLLSSIIMNKLPQDLRLVVSREIKDDEWQLDRIFLVLENELEARERAVVHNVTQSAGETKPFTRNQPRIKPTTAALLTKASEPT